MYAEKGRFMPHKRTAPPSVPNLYRTTSFATLSLRKWAAAVASYFQENSNSSTLASEISPGLDYAAAAGSSRSQGNFAAAAVYSTLQERNSPKKMSESKRRFCWIDVVSFRQCIGKQNIEKNRCSAISLSLSWQGLPRSSTIAQMLHPL